MAEHTRQDKNTKTQGKSEKLQWHPAFGAALKMEFIKEKESLSFDMEYPLNMKPLLIDYLIVKKVKDIVLENEIGKFFKGHNIIEYKSARDALSIDTVSKVQGYAYLYKSYGKSVDQIKLDDITATLIRESKPEALFKYFAENGYEVSNPYRGIYYIESGLKIPAQIIVGRELSSKGHEWLHLLSDKVTKQEMAQAIEYSRNTNNKEEKDLIDAIFEVSAAANKKVIEELVRGDETMCQALMEIMKPEIEEVVNIRVKETTERVERETATRTIKVAVSMLRSTNMSDAEIKEALQKNYGLSEQEALSYLK